MFSLFCIQSKRIEGFSVVVGMMTHEENICSPELCSEEYSNDKNFNNIRDTKLQFLKDETAMLC